MAVRGFDGSSRIVVALGNAATLNQGAVTIAVIAKRSQDNTESRAILSCQAAPTSSRRSFYAMTAGTLAFDSGGIEVPSTVDWLTAQGWCLIAVTKSAGDQIPRFHRYRYDLNTWAHVDAAASREDDGNALLHLSIGAISQDFHFRGSVAVVGAWQSALSDGALEGLTGALSAWVSANPAALWPLNQESTATPVPDITGGGADQTALVGTTIVSGDNPPFDFNLAPPSGGAAGSGWGVHA